MGRLLGDFNSRSRVWGDTTENEKGKVFEQFLISNNAVLLNNGQPTHYSVQHDTTSCTGAVLCSPTSASELQWEVVEEIFGRNHYPMVVSETTVVAEPPDLRYIMTRADWSLYSALGNIPAVTQEQDIDSLTERIITTLLERLIWQFLLHQVDHTEAPFYGGMKTVKIFLLKRKEPPEGTNVPTV